MRTLLIFLSIGLFFTLIQYSKGTPIDYISSESDEDDRIQEEQPINLKSVSSDNDQNGESSESDEILTQPKPVAIQLKENEEENGINETLELSKNLEEPRIHSVDQDYYDHEDDDKPTVQLVVNNDHQRILEDSDEN